MLELSERKAEDKVLEATLTALPLRLCAQPWTDSYDWPALGHVPTPVRVGGPYTNGEGEVSRTAVNLCRSLPCKTLLLPP